MGLVWIGVTLLGLSWVYLTPLAGSPDPAAAGLVVLLATLFLLAGLLRETRSAQPAAVAGAVGSALALVIVVTAVGTILQPVWVAMFSRLHRVSLLSGPLAAVVSSLGLPTAGDRASSVLAVDNGHHQLAFAVNAEQLGLPVLFRVLAAVALVLLVGRAGRRAWLATLVTLAAYLVLRFTTLIFLYANLLKPHEQGGLKPARLFYDPDLVLLSFLPLPFVLGWVLRRATRPECLLGLRLLKAPALAPAALLFLGAFCLAAGFLFVEPGSRKPGRILIDDYHSGSWEPSTETLDVRNYGSMSVYNFTSLANFLAHHYPSVRILTRDPLTAAGLAGVDVLILKTPTRPFSAAETDAILAFVERGGGLWLLGDHTNLLGMGTYINALGERFGLRFRYDACNALSTGYFGEWRPPRLAVHPVMQRVPWFRFLTSASLETSGSSDLVMNVPDLLSDPIDYSKPSFFGDISPDPADDFGILPTAAASRFGRGRVLAFSDSTVLSSFSVFQEGHIEFAMASVDYLNRRNVLGAWPNRGLLLAGAILAGLGTLRLLAGDPARIVTALLVGLVAGAVLGAVAVKQVHLAVYRPAEPITPYPSVGFLTKGAGFDLAPAISRILVPPGNEYSTFLVGMQRLGVVPAVVPDLDQLEKQSAAVIIHPEEGLGSEEVARLARYVERGGRLLLMLPPRPPGPAAQRLLDAFGVDYGKRAVRERFDPGKVAFGEGILEPAGAARESRLAGVANLPLRPGLPVEVGVKGRGRGKLVVLLGAAYFSRAEMGHVMEEKPNEDQMRRYRLQYLIVHDLLGLGSVEPPAVRAVETPKLADRNP